MPVPQGNALSPERNKTLSLFCNLEKYQSFKYNLLKNTPAENRKTRKQNPDLGLLK